MNDKTSTFDYIQGVHTQNLPNGRTLYKVRTVDGDEYSTFKPAIAEKARAFEGHEARIDYTVVEKTANNGTVYKNLWLDDIAEVERVVEPKPTPLPLDFASKDVQIARAVAMKAAVEYLSTPEQEREDLPTLLELVDVLTDNLLGR